MIFFFHVYAMWCRSLEQLTALHPVKHVFSKNNIFPRKKKQRWQDAPNVRPLARPAILHLVTYVFFFEKKYFLQKKKQTWQDAPNVRPLARPATLHLVTYVFFTKKYFLDFFEKNLFVCKKKNREDETRLMYGHSDDLQRFTLWHTYLFQKKIDFFLKKTEKTRRA